MWPFDSACEYCGDRGPDESCADCGRQFHTSCAEQAGDLTPKAQVSDVLTTAPSKYVWDCPDCDRHAHASG